MFVSQQQAAMAIGSGDYRTHDCGVIRKGSLVDGLFGESVTVSQLRKIGERDFLRICQSLERGFEIDETVFTVRRSEGPQLIALQRIAKANHRGFIIDLELNLQL